jgi:hypothetical protein
LGKSRNKVSVGEPAEGSLGRGTGVNGCDEHDECDEYDEYDRVGRRVEARLSLTHEDEGSGGEIQPTTTRNGSRKRAGGHEVSLARFRPCPAQLAERSGKRR